jgi:hypothetical protein
MKFSLSNDPGYRCLAICPSRLAQTAVMPDPAKNNWARRVNGTDQLSDARATRCDREAWITRFIQAIA